MAVRAGRILKEGGSRVGAAGVQRLLKPASFGTFLAGTRKVHKVFYLKSFHRGCGLWKLLLWKSFDKIYIHMGLWKAVNKPQSPCGEKNVAALRQNRVIHISFH